MCDELSVTMLLYLHLQSSTRNACTSLQHLHPHGSSQQVMQQWRQETYSIAMHQCD